MCKEPKRIGKTLMFTFYYLPFCDFQSIGTFALPVDMLAHELVGQAIPHLAGSDTVNAIQNENKVRAQLKKRKKCKKSQRS